ncbi:hypothetical protein [Noviherbaspirillum sp.]|uniref:hypothetical protein n=1 Tax=Noviherbaspirillum sp. TaxID=1926288 RepID=UPI002FDFB8ED
MSNKAKKIALLLLFAAGSAAQASNVDVGISVAGEVSPGVYGRVDIGNSRPQVLYQQPVMIVRQPRPVVVQPVYMHVPPGHAKKWDKHCHKYNACAQPVYFVKSSEYGNGKHKHKKHKHHDD